MSKLNTSKLNTNTIEKTPAVSLMVREGAAAPFGKTNTNQN